MSNTMQAAFVKRRNRVWIENIPIPDTGSSDILVKIDACGVCGSDYIDAQVWAKNRKQFGHEIVGHVVKIGSSVSNVTVGDQVIISLSSPCGECPACTSSNQRGCTAMLTAHQGGFSEYLLVPDERLVFRVKPQLPVEVAVFAEPLTVVLDAFRTSAIGSCDRLLVVGGGFIGRLAIITAKALGIDVAGIMTRRLDPETTSLSETLGFKVFPWKIFAGITIGPPDNLGEMVGNNAGKTVILHTAPSRYIAYYYKKIPFNSTIVNIGLSASRIDNYLFFNMSNAMFRRIQILNSFPVPCLTMTEAIALLQKHHKLFSLLSTEVQSLVQLPAIFGSNKRSGKKIVIVPDGLHSSLEGHNS